MRIGLIGAVLLSTGCAANISSHSFRAGGNDGYVGGWFVRQVGTTPSPVAVYYCDGSGECRQARTATPFSRAILAGTVEGPTAWVIGKTRAQPETEVVFLCTSSPAPVCMQQKEIPARPVSKP